MTQSARERLPEGFEVVGSADAGLFTPGACRFLADLVRTFGPAIGEALARRADVQAAIDDGKLPDFLPDTTEIRESDWTVAPIPPDLLDRRVEITGPVDRKMMINALNSGANVFMADFEDSLSPTWSNVQEGQKNLVDAAKGTIRHESGGKTYSLGERTAQLFVRPRGLHLVEAHLWLDGRAVPAALVDFGLAFFHAAPHLLAHGRRPYFYLPKLESHREARIWNDVFVRAEDALRLSRGTIRATVLVETLPAAFEMHEILWELRDHSVGLNCGRWDYIFSYIKKLGAHAAFTIPDRGDVTMTQPFLRAYTELLVQTCHRRGAHAMGGMAAQIPIKGDDAANRAALEKVRADKVREATDGHDGTWVAHPGLVPIAREVFDQHVAGPNQIDRRRDDVRVTAADLLRVPEGPRTEAGLRHDVRVALRYLESWLRGVGCVPIDGLMEDAATAEISRMQVWQWLGHGVSLDGGPPLGPARVRRAIEEEARAFSGGRFAEARELFEAVATTAHREDFLTIPAYAVLRGLEDKEGLR